MKHYTGQRQRSASPGSRRSLVGIAATMLAATLLAGCASNGPAAIERDRFNYVAAMSESWKMQMLLNLLKIRYADAPVFLEVYSVINAYSFEGRLQLGGQAGSGDRTIHGSADAFYADRPTITYVPLVGDRFARTVMSPIPIGSVLALVESGYPVDIVLRFCVSAVNGLENSWGGFRDHAGDPRFQELLQLLGEEQTAHGMNLGVRGGQHPGALTWTFRKAPDATMAARHRRISELLGVTADASELSVTYGAFPSTKTEVAIQTRSIAQILIDVASYIEVPESDATQGRITVPVRSAEQQRLFTPLLRVSHGDTAPADAYVAARYRGTSFWIEDRDYNTKAAFNFFMYLFSLSETAPTTSAAPVVTVPAR